MHLLKKVQGMDAVGTDTPAWQKLKQAPFPDVAAALRQKAPRILDRFRDEAKALLPDADELTFAELTDHLPKALEDLAVAVAAAGDEGAKSFLTDSAMHGSCRFHQSFNLGELLSEYSILRSIILEEVISAMDRPLEVIELAGLNAGIDAAARRSVQAFIEYQRAQIQGASEAYSKYLSFLSHDLRGSLNGILLMLEVLRRELSPHSQFKGSLDDLNLMRRSILDTVSMMDRFLHAERFRRGKVQVKPMEFNLQGLLQTIASQFAQQAREKKIELLVDAGPCGQIVSDRDLIQLIFQNLISNAMKYSSAGSIHVSGTMIADGGCRISVRDQGPGISKERLGELFAPFVRGDTHGQSGVGLGLSIARQAADLLTARLWAESEVGSGSTFFLDIPRTSKSGSVEPASNP